MVDAHGMGGQVTLGRRKTHWASMENLHAVVLNDEGDNLEPMQKRARKWGHKYYCKHFGQGTNKDKRIRTWGWVQERRALLILQWS
jgi:hypothetical protein